MEGDDFDAVYISRREVLFIVIRSFMIVFIYIDDGQGLPKFNINN